MTNGNMLISQIFVFFRQFRELGYDQQLTELRIVVQFHILLMLIGLTIIKHIISLPFSMNFHNFDENKIISYIQYFQRFIKMNNFMKLS